MNSDHIIKQFEPLWGVWSVEKKLGEGTYGSVYQVSRKDWDRSYEAAVKVISIPSSSNEVKEAYSNGADDNSISTYFEDAMKNMIKEIEFMYKFKGNSYIVSYEDHWIHTKYNEPGWHIFIRMELLKPLNEYFRGKFASELDIVRIGIQICHALESCYQNGVIHRDIKDANIFVTNDGNFKLGDFGIARELSRTSKAATMKGTPNYMAPEVYKSLEYNHTADIYSLGMVLYKMANHNRYPFAPDYPNPLTSVDNENALLARLEGKSIKRPMMVSDELGDIILKACEFNPENRYNTPKAFRIALENYEKVIEAGLGDSKVNHNVEDENETEYLLSNKGNGTVSVYDDDTSKTLKEKERIEKEEKLRKEKEEKERKEKEEKERKEKEEKERIEKEEKDKIKREKKRKVLGIALIAAALVILVGGTFAMTKLLGDGEDKEKATDVISKEVEEDTSNQVENNQASTEAVAELTWSINQPQIKLNGGETFKVEMKTTEDINPSDYKWTWSSRDENVVKVDEDGNLTAIGNGKTVISASLEGTNKVYNAEVEVLGVVAQVSTEAPTEPPTQAATQKTTQPTTQPTTQKTTQKTTQPTTEKTTQPTTQATTQAASITFGDATFESLVRKAAGKPTGTLTSDDLSKIYTLDINSSGITSISGIQHIKNLKQLNLSYNSLTDISKLSGLTKLTYLNLKGNSITSITALKNLTNLKKLYLSGNPISDYSPTNGYFSQLEDQDFK